MSRKTKIKSTLIVEDSLELKNVPAGSVPVVDQDGKIVASVVTAEELSNLSGITSPIQEQLTGETEKIDNHIEDTTNPHSVTKEQVGLSDVDNTSDLDKPVSIATQAALDLKYDASNPAQFVDAAGASDAAPVQSVSGRVGDVILTKDDVGLEEVDNTSDLDKPVSTATQSALDLKYDASNPAGFITLAQAQSSAVASVNGRIGEVILDKTDVGLDEVDNTSDLDKPVSTATQSALDLKYDASNPLSFVDATGASDAAPVQSVSGRIGDITLTKQDVGLTNVDNTSDLDKPISALTQSALDLKYDASNPAGYITLAQVQEGAVASVNGKTGTVVLDKTDIGLENVDNTTDLDKPISTATQTALNLKIDSSREGQPEGIATLDEAGKVPATQLPSYVDDVLEFADFASLPTEGETGKIYVTIDNSKCFRWSGSTYVEVSPSEVNSVNGKTGVVTLDKEDIGLDQVDNTSDLDKPISTATQTALNLKYDASNPAGYITISSVITQHSGLSGLENDDHPQYHTDDRGDARYYTKSQVDTLIGPGSSPGDIGELSFSLSNGQIVPQDITGFTFQTATVRGFTALVTVEINANTTLYEQFTLSGIQKNGTWNMATESVGDNSDILFSISSSGQIQYVSGSYAGFQDGKIKFRAITTRV
jgi:hypothetical protein